MKFLVLFLAHMMAISIKSIWLEYIIIKIHSQGLIGGRKFNRNDIIKNYLGI